MLGEIKHKWGFLKIVLHISLSLCIHPSYGIISEKACYLTKDVSKASQESQCKKYISGQNNKENTTAGVIIYLQKKMVEEMSEYKTKQLQ